MAIQLIQHPKYSFKRKGFEGVTFTRSSSMPLIWPEAVKFADDRDTVLQSLCEALAFRVEANGEDYANYSQATRTTAAYFMKNGTAYVAFDDTPDAYQNIVLARAQEGYDANTADKKSILSFNELLLPLENKQLKELFIRAEKADRIRKLPKSNLELALSEYAKNDIVCALEQDIAEPHAQFLKQAGYNTGYVMLPSPEFVGNNTDGKSAIIIPVHLGGNDYSSIQAVNANAQFACKGHARGVRGGHEIYSGNKK